MSIIETVRAEESAPIKITSVEITVFQAKGTVESVVHHEPVTLHAEDEGRSLVTHRARRFERLAACPVATGQALYETSRAMFGGVPVSLRFA